MRIFSLFLYTILIVACAGMNPNPGERTADMAWTSGNFNRALSVAKPKAEAGEPWAQLRMAMFYENGWGVDKDLEKAFSWYSKAAEQKDESEWGNGLLIGAAGRPGYFNQNSDALIAEYNLADLYSRGEGVKKNLIKSYIHVSNVIKETKGKSLFFCCEFENGQYLNQSQVTNLRDKVKAEMTPDQLSKVNKMLGS